MNDELTGLQAEQVYWARTDRLRQRCAGLELAVHIRDLIELEYMQLRFKEIRSDAKLRLDLKPFSEVIRLNDSLRRLFRDTGPDEQRAIIVKILGPHVKARAIPKYELHDVDDGGEPYLVLECDYVM